MLTRKIHGLLVDVSLFTEPLGFVRVLEWIFSIFAFATCGGYKGATTILVSCQGAINKTATAVFAYPFRLNTALFSAPNPTRCNNTWTDTYLVGDFSSSAQFFVAVAVLAFLYCIAALALYVGYMHVYRSNSKIPLTDFVVTVIGAFLWLVSTSAWAKALTDIKIATGLSIVPEIAACQLPGSTCLFASVTSMGGLNVSVVFGLLNMILWGGNAWFVYKETTLHNPSNTASQHPGIYPTPSGI
ncbi:synaptophysin-like protein 1 isoform X1 [Alligator mississippiensis]|uniref:Synaptophysin-like protein 1 n=1 Tax=Alligator mississippiensis TaxID=8496 RepID=A0A151NPJ5_ALLMI|nr:synaptophysin-like protein 1 isoform X1 [Alligator mississippiensis]KYO38630.1 synaptophysin-like protein 1 [Alligator mississippiensis]